MRAGSVPSCRPDTRMRDVIYEMSSKQLGMTCVVDGSEELLGIITDGDLRRQMERTSDVLTLAAADVMTRGPVTVPRVDARRRSAEHHGAAQDHVDRRGRGRQPAGRRRRARARPVARRNCSEMVRRLLNDWTSPDSTRGCSRPARAVRCRRRPDRWPGGAARRRQRKQAVPHSRRHRDGLGAARRAENRLALRAHSATTTERARRSWASRSCTRVCRARSTRTTKS